MQLPELWAVHPMMIVIVVPAETEPVVSHIMLGDVIDELALQVILLVTTVAGKPPLAFSPLKAKDVAEGEAELSAEPGKVIKTSPPAGISVAVVNWIVWTAVTGTIKTCTPEAPLFPIVSLKYTVCKSAD